MIEEIKKEISQECQKYSTGDSNYAMGIKEGLDKALKTLDKYNNKKACPLPQHNNAIDNSSFGANEETILYVGSRIGKSLQTVQYIVKYINDNKLTECNINVQEVPNDYKLAWEELKRNNSKNKNRNYEQAWILTAIKELEQKYNLGGIK